MNDITKPQTIGLIDLFNRNRPLTDLQTYLTNKCDITISAVGLGRWLKKNGHTRKAIPKRRSKTT